MRIHILQILFDLRPRSERKCAEHQIVIHGQVRKDAAPLGDVRHAEPDNLVRGCLDEILPLKLDAAGLGCDQPGDRMQNGGLASAVCADQRDDLALVDLKGHAFDGIDDAVINLQIFYL